MEWGQKRFKMIDTGIEETITGLIQDDYGVIHNEEKC